MRAIILLLALACSTSFAVADIIECDNGDRYNGKVLSMDETKVKLQNDITGTLTIPRSRIVSISFRAAGSPAVAGKTVPRASTNGLPGKADGLQVDAATVERVQNEYLAGASPEATQLYQEMVRGLSTGQLNLGDIRAKAATTLQELRAMQKELGDEDAGALLDTYGAILENFIRQVPATNTAPKATPPPVVQDTEE